MRTRLAALLAILAAGLTGPAPLAEDPCADDLQRLCPDVKPGSGRVVGCLRAKRAELSAACGERLDADALKARRLVEAFGRACRADVREFCPAIEPGGGRVLGCLAQHQLELSTPCQAEMDRLAEARERVSVLRRACTADLERVCKGVPPQAGPILECLEANQASLSAECSAADVRRAVEASSLVDVVEQMGQQDRIKEALEILQGVDSVAFSRSQVLVQLDSYQALGGKGNAFRLLFNPQFVFGARNEFALQVKVPVTTLFPYDAARATQSGLGDVTTAFAWNFFAHGQMRHYASIGLQWQTAAQPALGAAWAVTPAYAVALGLARWMSLTVQAAWSRSVGSTGGYPEIDVLLLEPILVANLPGRSFLALDTKLGWDLVRGTFVPVMKGVAGLFTDRQKSLSISAWYQGALTSAAVSQSFQFGVGMSLAYYFDW
jgi:hypothetical protein